MTKVPDESSISADGSANALTRENGNRETGGGETPQLCPRCGAPDAPEFYGPCSACISELRANAAPTPVETPKAPPLVTGIVATRRHWTHKRRTVLFAPKGLAGTGVDSTGRTVTVSGVESCRPYRMVYVCGAGADGWVRRVTGEPVEGWQRTALHDHDRHPSVTFTRTDGGESVRLTTVAAWAGDDDLAPAAVAEAWRWVAEQVDAMAGGQLLATPSSTGRDLMARLLPRDAELPTITAELGDEIRATSTQHRMTLEAPGAEVEWFTELDMRLAFAAVVRSMPVGVPVRMKGEPDTYNPHRAGRYLCDWEVPRGWTGPGLLPMSTGSGWEWSGVPGHLAGGWLDGSELRLARMNGWDVTVSESVLWPAKPSCDPLRTWQEKLTSAYKAAAAAGLPDGVGLIARRMLRSIIIHSIGSLRGKGEMFTNTCAAEDAERMVPADAEWWTTDDGAVVWVERREPAWEEWCRPEWTASIWARTRCRLLDGPGAKIGGRPAKPTGALHLPASVRLIGFRGDALYLTGDPGWHDDGAPGRYVVKSERSGFTVPATLAELDRLRATPAPATAAGPKAARAALTAGRR